MTPSYVCRIRTYFSGIAIAMPPDGLRVRVIPAKIHALGSGECRERAQLSLPERRYDRNWQVEFPAVTFGGAVDPAERPSK
jgi:hypothetical protein